jgi:hypothetical protein
LGVALVALVLFKGSSSFPVAKVAATAGAAFVWLNGVFWWLELRYPHIEQPSGTFVSRLEQSSSYMRSYSGVFFGVYGIGALLVTIAAYRVASGA